ncbi:MAG TPA: MFS transporter [Sphingomonas sp.]|uniref:MFS transporter n=1 Tax=Sphingomonas sp. TaxID=28214 RepID=UPI002ED7EA57
MMRSVQGGGNPPEAGWPQGMTLLVQQALPTMGPLLLVPVLPLILREYGAMPGAAYWVPSLLTVPALCMALLSVFAGALGDRIGRRAPLIAALTLYGAAGMAPLFLSGFNAILVSRLLLGICEAMIVTLSMTMLADYFTGVRRDRWLALVSTVASGSAVLFLALSGVLGARFGWRAPTAVYGLSLLIVPAMLAFTWEPKHARGPAADAPGQAFPWAHVLAVGAATLVGGSFFFIVAIQQAFGLIELGVTDPARIGLLTSVCGLGNPIGSLIFRRFVTTRTSRLIAVEMALLGGGMLMMSQAGSDIAFSVSAFCALIGAGMLMPTLVTWMVRGLPFAARGRGVGIFQSLFSAGQFASGLILPFLARNVVDGFLSAFAVLGVTGFVIALCAVVRSLGGGVPHLPNGAPA